MAKQSFLYLSYIYLTRKQVHFIWWKKKQVSLSKIRVFSWGTVPRTKKRFLWTVDILLVCRSREHLNHFSSIFTCFYGICCVRSYYFILPQNIIIYTRFGQYETGNIGCFLVFMCLRLLKDSAFYLFFVSVFSMAN